MCVCVHKWLTIREVVDENQNHHKKYMTKCVNEESVKAQNKTIMNPKLQMKWLHLKNKF